MSILFHFWMLTRLQGSAQCRRFLKVFPDLHTHTAPSARSEVSFSGPKQMMITLG